MMIGVFMEKYMIFDVGLDVFWDGYFGWYYVFDKQECWVFWSCKIGYGLDGMDIQMFSFVIFILIVLWGIGIGEVGFIYIMILFVFVVGGWIVGIFFDCIGWVLIL